jgi:hypothetical protein
MTSPQKFLAAVWRDVPNTARTFTAVRTTGWSEYCDFGLDSSFGEWSDDGDSYFCPHTFATADRRNSEHGGEPLPTRWLHADLDEVDPRTLTLVPTLAWETSPGRYQALWRLTKPVSEDNFHKLNRALTYAVGADKGGWSITKYLRIPGTVNAKYPDKPTVKLLWAKKVQYTTKDVVAFLKLQQPVVAKTASVNSAQVVKRLTLPTSIKSLLRSRVAPEGQRSEKMWSITCALLEAGATDDETMVVLRDTAWNKWSGFTNEDRQLRNEIQRAHAHLAKVAHRRQVNGTRPQVNGGLFRDYSDFIQKEPPAYLWLVDSVWSADGHGLIVGEPKTYKSLIAMEMAFAVASGTKFLNEFEVPATGPVLLIQRENPDHLVVDRFKKMAISRGLMSSEDARMEGRKTIVMPEAPASLPIKMLPLDVPFDLRNADDIHMLEKEIQETQPKLVVLDPLYMMARGLDENSNMAVSEVLQTLLQIKAKYGVGLLLVHHFNKAHEDEGRSLMTRISGAGALARWFESALYLEKGKSFGELTMTPEHRLSPSNTKIKVEIDMGDIGEDHYDVHVETYQVEAVRSLVKSVVELVTDREGITIAEVAKALDISNDRTKRIVMKSEGLQIRGGVKDGSPGRPSPRIFLVKD